MIGKTRTPNGLMALIDISLMTAFVALAQSAFLSHETARHMTLDVQLPREAGQGGSAKAGESVDIMLQRDGRLHINGAVVDLADLPRRVSPHRAVRIVADRDARAETLLRLGHTLSEIGVGTVTYLVEGGKK